MRMELASRTKIVFGTPRFYAQNAGLTMTKGGYAESRILRARWYSVSA